MLAAVHHKAGDPGSTLMTFERGRIGVFQDQAALDAVAHFFNLEASLIEVPVGTPGYYILMPWCAPFDVVAVAPEDREDAEALKRAIMTVRPEAPDVAPFEDLVAEATETEQPAPTVAVPKRLGPVKFVGIDQLAPVQP